MKKRALTLLLALAMCLSLCTPVMAEEVTPERTIVYTTTAEERDAIFEAEVEKALAALSNGSAREVRYQYKSENLTDKYKIKTVGGFAGNQVQNGYRFPTGGGFYFSDVGGPTVQGSVNLGLPKPFDTVSFTVTLGTRSTVSGLVVNAPNTTDYFKLYVEKEVEARPYKVYKRLPGNGNAWEFDRYGVVYVTVGVVAYEKKV